MIVRFGSKADICRRKTACPLYSRKQTCAVQERMSALGRHAQTICLLCKLHQLEGRATIWAVGVAERFTYLKMIIVRGFNQLDGLTSRLYRSGKIAALPLKLRSLVAAVSDGDRCSQLIDVSLRAHRVLHLIGEFDI